MPTKKMGYALCLVLTIVALGSITTSGSSARVAKPPYLESCTYDAYGRVTGYTCGFTNHGDTCDIANC
jgi:hypothetical protein